MCTPPRFLLSVTNMEWEQLFNQFYTNESSVCINHFLVELAKKGWGEGRHILNGEGELFNGNTHSVTYKRLAFLSC